MDPPAENQGGRAVVSLAISQGDLSEAELSAALGRPCDKYHRAGDKIGGSELTHPESEWILEAAPVPADSAEECVERFVGEVAELTAKIASLDGADVTLSISVTSGAEVGLYLDPDVVGALTRMGAAIDISFD